MQIQSLRIKSYRSFRIDDTTPAEAFERLRKIETYQALRAEGCGEAAGAARHRLVPGRVFPLASALPGRRSEGAGGPKPPTAPDESQALDAYARVGGVADAQEVSVPGQEASSGDARPRGRRAVGINPPIGPGAGWGES